RTAEAIMSKQLLPFSTAPTISGPALRRRKGARDCEPGAAIALSSSGEDRGGGGHGSRQNRLADHGAERLAYLGAVSDHRCLRLCGCRLLPVDGRRLC